MIQILYSATFIRSLKNLPVDLQNEASEKIELFVFRENHKSLKVHKLHAKFKDYYSFSVNFKTRIVFRYLEKDMAFFAAIGDHEVYK